MSSAHRKYLDDMKQRLKENPRTVNCNMLINTITREIPSKLIPLFVKQEVCRNLSELQEFLKEHKWARKELKQDLLDLFNVVRDANENYEGFLRVQYAKFRNRVAEVKARTLPPQRIEMATQYRESLIKLRQGKEPKNLMCPDSSKLWTEALRQRCADFHYTPLLQYSSPGMKVRGSIHEQLDIPGIVADLNILKNLLEDILTLVGEKIGSSHAQAAYSALDTVPILLKMDGVWLAGCSKMKELLSDLHQQIQNDPETFFSSLQNLLSVTLPILRKCKDWIKIDEIAEMAMRKRTDRLGVTPDEMMVQTKNLLFNHSHDDCN